MPATRQVTSDPEVLSAVIDAAQVAMVLISASGRIELVNLAAGQLFRVERDQLIGSPLEILLPERFRSRHTKLFHAYVHNQFATSIKVRRSLRALRADGSELSVRVWLTPVRTSGQPYALATLFEFGQTILLEDRFRVAVESLPAAIVMVDEEGKIVLVNRQTELMFGYRRDELCGTHVDVLLPARNQAHHSAFCHQFFKESEARPMGDGLDLFAVRRDGTELSVEIGLNPITTDEGHFVLCAIFDVTGRKSEMSLLANHALELQRSNEELEQFAYVASHDLQEPLRMVVSYMQLLEERYQGKLDARADKYIGYAVDGSRRMQHLVRDLLAYSRVGSQGKPLTPTSSADVVKWVLHGMEQSIDESGATVKVGRLPKVMADEVQLGQVFQNLIGNALKFAREEPPQIRVDAKRRGPYCVFSVSDNGIGIAAEHSNRIFQMFQRLHERGTYEGSGVGLAIAKRIVERHGGSIWFESTVGQGTVFFFTMYAPTESPS